MTPRFKRCSPRLVSISRSCLRDETQARTRCCPGEGTVNNAWPPGHALESARRQKSAFVILVTLPASVGMLFAGATSGMALAAPLVAAWVTLVALAALIALVARLAPLALIASFFVLALWLISRAAFAAPLPALPALAALATFVTALTPLIARCHVNFL